MPIYEYDSNNSGGGWWLTDEDWRALERGGWKVRWFKDEPAGSVAAGLISGEDGRFLGALATSARKEFPSLDDAILDFERITGADYEEEGCECCGRPHYISEVRGWYNDSSS